MPTRKFSELTKDWSPELRERIAREAREITAAMPLEQIRKSQQMTQLALADTLGVNQGEVSKIEHRTDLYLSTLSDYVEALGGELEIRAVFPDREVRIVIGDKVAGKVLAKR